MHAGLFAHGAGGGGCSLNVHLILVVVVIPPNRKASGSLRFTVIYIVV